MSGALAETFAEHQYCGIPIRNIWLLMLYASDLFAEVEKRQNRVERERVAENIPDIIAEVLVYFVRERLLRGLTRASLPKQADLTRVRGRIDTLRTARYMLLERGRVACRYHEPTLNTPRNRLIKTALERGGHIVARPDLKEKCRDFATLMFRLGVKDALPTREELSQEVYGVNDVYDRHAVAAAHLLLDMFIPATFAGAESLISPQEKDRWLRRLFEKSVRGFYRVTAGEHWDVHPGNKRQDWPILEPSEDVSRLLPQMELDIVLTNAERERKIVIDTKYTQMITQGFHRENTLETRHMYQMYAYLLSQNESRMDRTARGILLYPAVDDSADVAFEMQGHHILFATVNLNADAKSIRRELLALVDIAE